MLRVALTGGIASGKSYVLRLFATHGLATIDADVLAREVVRPGTPGLAAIVERFGRELLRPDGTLDRGRLGQQIFSNEGARRDLEQIIHPAVYRAIDAAFAHLDQDGARLGVADIPLLFETGHENEFHRIVVTSCPRDVQIERMMTRDHLSREEAEQRLATQWPIDQKEAGADFVVHTAVPFEETNRQVAAVVEALRAEGA
ncbi:MAG: dephospho-CoA kinase [Luteitalea sp.]|nr:dephospho-CoA kinase [Luteitalea sp.]